MQAHIEKPLFGHGSERKFRTAVTTNNTDLVRHLLANGVNVNSSDEQSRSALHFAAAKGYSEIVNVLLQNGADPNAKDILGNTALHLAACTNHIGKKHALKKYDQFALNTRSNITQVVPTYKNNE